MLSTKNSPIEAGLSATEQRAKNYIRGLLRQGSSSAVNIDDVEDILQRSRIRAYENFERGVIPRDFTAWFIRICMTITMDHKRTLRRKPTVALAVTDNDDNEIDTSRLADSRHDPACFNSIEDANLSGAIMSLSTEEQQILHCFFWQQKSQSAISHELRLPPKRVSPLLASAVSALRSSLNPHYTDLSGSVSDTSATPLATLLDNLLSLYQSPIPVAA